MNKNENSICRFKGDIELWKKFTYMNKKNKIKTWSLIKPFILEYINSVKK